MAPRKSEHPTDAELEVLAVLWDRGPCTVREVHDALSQTREMGYTSVLKVMQIMFDKSLLTRDESRRSHVYSAKRKQTDTQQQLIKVLVDKAFSGATDQLVLQALNAKNVTPGEIAEIRRILDKLEDK